MAGQISVLHIADKFGVRGSSVHGVSRLFSWWLPRFDHDRYDVRLVGLRQADDACANLQQQGIEVISLNKGKFDFSTVAAIVRLVKRYDAKILHLHGYGASNFGRIAAKIARVKTIIHEHFVDPAMPRYQIPFDFGLAPFTDYGIAVSASVKKFMVKERFLPPQKVEVIFNGAPLGDFQPVLEIERLAQEKRKWGIPEDCPVLGSIGRLDEQKGNRYLLQAAAILLKKGLKFKLMIIGDGPYMEQLQAQCRELAIDNDVVFTGYQSDIPLLQSLLTIQVFPSLWEGTPLTLFEAMAMARPIVATPVDGLGEVLRDGHNGRLVPARDAGALADALEEVLTDKEKRFQLGEQAKCDSKKFDIQGTVNRIQRVYDGLLVS